MFNQDYVTRFDAQLNKVNELVNPKDETAMLKVTTRRIYQTMDSLAEANHRLEGYIELAGEKISISPADFGISELRKALRTRDAEKTLNSMKTLLNFCTTFQTALTEAGAPETLFGQYRAARKKHQEEKQKPNLSIQNAANRFPVRSNGNRNDANKIRYNANKIRNDANEDLNGHKTIQNRVKTIRKTQPPGVGLSRSDTST